MDVINETGLQTAWLQGRIRFPQHSLTLIVKGTFRLAPGGVAALDEEADQPPVTGDVFYDDEPENGCRYETDFVHFKPRADLLLVGTCHAPEARPVPACRVSFGVGDRVKSLAVFGDRTWTGNGPARRPSDPVPFTTMPLDYRHAYGGEGCAQNPLGKGFAGTTTSDGRTIWPLPNIADPNQAIGTPGQASRPAGFGPLGRMWPQRRANMGTYDEKWQNERWPWYPADFDWGHFNAAPADQQVEGYLRGDEALLFENLHPEHPEYRSRLPGLRVRCFLHEQYEGRRLVRDVPMKLDTLWADMGAEEVVLVWRGLATVRSQDIDELEHLMVVTEPVAEAPRPTEHYAQQMAERLAEAEAGTVGAAPEPAPAEADAEVDVDLAAVEADVKAEVAAALDRMREQMSASRVDFDKVKSIVLAADPVAALNEFLAEAGVDPAGIETTLEAGRQQAMALLKTRGLDPGLAAELEKQAKGGAGAEVPPPELPAARAAPGADFVGEDLSGADFSGRDLKGADFRDAILAGANFAGAELGEADFTGANLGSANLGEARLAGAKLDGADLTRAVLGGAELTRASLAGATLEEADLSGANLAGASAPEASFVGATLTEANLEGAALEKADLSRATLDRANFQDAALARVECGGAAGAGLVMTGADVTELRAGGCRFPGGAFQNLRGEGSLWFESDLSGADFTASDLVRADFRGADLRSSNFHAVELKNGNLTKANLSAARFTAVNLFQVRLDKADLTGTDLRGSNCYEADFIDAVITGARFERANLTMTKLARLHAQG
ncbi:MAG: DUF2169 domain-containing protein [Kiloniellaceae bacterium]